MSRPARLPSATDSTAGRPRDDGRSAVESYYESILPFYAWEGVRRSDLAFWRRIARRVRPRLAVELGSGFGRVTEAIVPHAGRVVGIDVVWPMLRAAAKRVGRASFAAADMRRIPFAGLCDLVVAPSDPISHWLQSSDRLRILREIRHATAPEGLLVLDGLYRPEAVEIRRTRHLPLPGGSLTVNELWQPLARRDLWSVQYRYRLTRHGVLQTHEAAFVARAWSPEGLARLLELAGFRLESLSGDFDRSPVGPRSERLLAFARPSRRPRSQRGTGGSPTLAGPLRTSPSAVNREP